MSYELALMKIPVCPFILSFLISEKMSAAFIGMNNFDAWDIFVNLQLPS